MMGGYDILRSIMGSTIATLLLIPALAVAFVYAVVCTFGDIWRHK